MPQAFWYLLVADLLLRLGGYTRFKRFLGRPSTQRAPASDAYTIALAAHDAVGLASTWYLHSARCLQRAAAAALVLKARGVASVLVIGVRTMPFGGHAWLEIDGRVVAEDRWTLEPYVVLERIAVVTGSECRDDGTVGDVVGRR